MDTDGPPFGERLRELRQARHLTIPELAQAAGLDRVYLYRLERGERVDPGWRTVRALADALDVSTEVFRGAGEIPGKIPNNP